MNWCVSVCVCVRVQHQFPCTSKMTIMLANAVMDNGGEDDHGDDSDNDAGGADDDGGDDDDGDNGDVVMALVVLVK